MLERITYTDKNKILTVYPNGVYLNDAGQLIGASLPPLYLPPPHKFHTKAQQTHPNPFFRPPPPSDDAMDEDQSSEEEEWSYPLKKYIKHAWMPACQTGPRARQNGHWPWYPELRVRPGTRTLHTVDRIAGETIRNATYKWLQGLADAQLTSELMNAGQLSDLALPDTELSILDANDMHYLEHFYLNSATDVSRLLHSYALTTVSKAFQLLMGIPPTHPLGQLLHFRQVYNRIPVEGARFDVLGLPALKESELTMMVFVVPPWEKVENYMKDFALAGLIGDHSLDMNPSNHPPLRATILWAVIWQMCADNNCRYFTVTNYDQWIFGNLSQDLHTAQVTSPMKAPVFKKESTVTADQIPRPNILECLLFWMGAATNHSLFPLPRNSAH
ncbi:hypothetical protein F5I97DRAFT_1922630 [Phlebopus sp. FC_14]|nr:hypothetical protein F5I97DRAFT_1922630 [Phlebopus sp. FC_14]